MKWIVGLLATAALAIGCGTPSNAAGIVPSHPWLDDESIQFPPDNLAEARVLSAIRDLAADAGIDGRGLLVEFHGTTRQVPDGPKAGLRALTFTVAVSGEEAAVLAFLERLEQGEPYQTLVVEDKDMRVNDSASARVRFSVYTMPHGSGGV